MENNNKTELSLKVTKTIVEYLKEVRKENPNFKTAKVLEVAFNCAKESEEDVLDAETKAKVTNFVKICLTVLEEVGAIKRTRTLNIRLEDYLYEKHNKVLVRPIHGKDVGYYISREFNKKVSALKINEIIKGSKIIEVDLGKKTVSVLAVNNVPFDKIKFCNSMFNYTGLADYIGCYNESTNKVDFVSTLDERKVFFTSNKKHVLPEKREIIDLFSIINLSDDKKLFQDAEYLNKKQTVLSLRPANYNSSLSTENLVITR